MTICGGSPLPIIRGTEKDASMDVNMKAPATARDALDIGNRMSLICRKQEAPKFRAASRNVSSTDRYAPSTKSTDSARFFQMSDTAIPIQPNAIEGRSLML